MLKYTIKEQSIIQGLNKPIYSFIEKKQDSNIDWITVESFGDEWLKFNNFKDAEIDQIGNEYFDIITDEMLNNKSLALDVGCGTGRWTKYVSKRAKFVEAIDPSKAVISAAQLLQSCPNVRITQAELSNLPFDDESFDFVFSLGVLHHIPDTQQAIADCVKKVKKGGYFMVYLYYNLDSRGFLYKSLFHISSIFRAIVCRLPSKLKLFTCDLIAYLVYVPLISFARIVRNLFPNKKWYQKLPLAVYVNNSISVIRNDALDRFGTPLEQRFSKIEIERMMASCDLTNIVFSTGNPYWHAVGQKL
jgi:SAM-dependent methyltransferase